MTAYVDTSVIVAALSNEAETGTAQEWLTRQDAGSLCISDWTFTEVSSAIAIKLRRGEVSLEARAAILGVFARLVAESITVLPVTGAHFRTAARFVDHHALGLRAGDALHLAVAADHGAVIHTLDRRLAAAGPVLGVATSLLG